MLRTLTLTAFLVVGLGALVFVPTRPAQSNSGGGNARSAGVPGESTCASSGCHASFALNSGSGSVVITSADSYVAETALNLTVRVAQSEAATYGFQIAARDANGDPVGSFELIDQGTRFSGSTSIGQRYVGHNAPRESGEWSVRWLPQTDQSGDVTFYATGNAANGNGGSSGDRIYSTSRVVTQAQGTPVEGINEAAGLQLTVRGEHPIETDDSCSGRRRHAGDAGALRCAGPNADDDSVHKRSGSAGPRRTGGWSLSARRRHASRPRDSERRSALTGEQGVLELLENTCGQLLCRVDAEVARVVG